MNLAIAIKITFAEKLIPILFDFLARQVTFTSSKSFLEILLGKYVILVSIDYVKHLSQVVLRQENVAVYSDTQKDRKVNLL